MKRLLCALLVLAAAAACWGCSWMKGHYVSVEAHQVGYLQKDQDSTLVTSYSELRSAVTGMVDARSEEAVFTLSGYSEEHARNDVENVIRYTLSSYPMGVYAVDDIRYEYGQNLLSIQISYRRSSAEMEQVRTVRGMDSVRSTIAGSLEKYDDALVLLVTGYIETDFIQYVADYAALHPEIVMELPQVAVQTYPQQGVIRILELRFSYQNSRESLRDMLRQVTPVFSSARLYVTSDAEDSTKLSQLYSFLMERFDYSIQTSITPGYSLLCYGVGDSKAFAQVYASMCRQVGVEAMTVSGTCNGESRFWNIVRNGDKYYHVDLLACARQGYYRELADWEMGNYVWDYSAYPACGVETEIPES